MKKGDRIPGLVGWEFHGEPADIPGLEVVAEGTTLTGGDAGVALHGDDLSRAEGQLRLQRLDDLLGAGPVGAAGPHAADLAPRPPARPGRAGAADHQECV